MSKTKPVTFANRGFWGYDVAVGIFLKYLIDAAQLSPEAGTPWLTEALSSWRLCAVLDVGLTLSADWSPEQLKSLIAIAENACTALATRVSISAEEIVSWQLADDLRIYPRGEKEVFTAPVC